MALNLILKRTFSTGFNLKQAVQLPVQVHGIEGKYAAALYTSAIKAKSLDAVDKDLTEIKNLYNTHKDFKLFIENPTLNRLKKRSAIEMVLQKVGVSQETKNFFGILAENGRLNKLKQVFNSFETIMRAHRGEIFVEVTTAEPLSKRHEQALNDALQNFVKHGKKLHIKYAIKPSLLGGLIINIGEKYVDLSIATRFNKLKDALASAL